jgi:MOSC domain-containing protein YiiM
VTPTLLSIQVGLPVRYGADGAKHPMDRPWRSAIAKQPVDGPVWVGRWNVSGDAQSDLEAHGGVEKAVLAYAAGHYDDWRRELARPDLPFGAFGENFTVAGLDEARVCIGDVVELGDAVLQVSQPRLPCFKLAYRWRIKDLTARVRASRRPGWYLRVLREGYVEAGQAVELVERPHPRWRVLDALEVEDDPRGQPALARELAACEALTPAWRVWLVQEAEKAEGRAA